MPRFVVVVMSLLFLCSACTARAESPAKPLFDPSRHMRVSEVKTGMKGYGLSVFSGTKIEKFDVEVIDVVHDFNPKYDVVLIRCMGPFLEHTGAIEGMSGSPIYLFDDKGQARMIGAFAYGWPYTKDPIGGVQPIEYMLSLPVPDKQDAAAGNGQADSGQLSPQSAEKQAALPRWSLDDISLPAWQRAGAKHLVASSDHQSHFVQRNGQTIRLTPLASPLMAGGIGSRTLARLAPLFEGSGLIPMQAGELSGHSDDNAPDPKLEPGSVLAVPLLTGDLELSAIGTCTETIGDRVFGFGHQFDDEPSRGAGPVGLPAGSGSIATVVANLQTSFKLGFLSKPSGTLVADQIVGVAGWMGRLPPMIPIELHVVYDDGTIDRTYHFQAAQHPKLTPTVVAVALSAAITGDKDLPEYHTVDYDLAMDFANNQTVHVVNRSVNAGPADLLNDLVLPIAATLDNPFGQVPLKKLTGEVHVSKIARSAKIISVMVSRSKFEPGEAVKAYISYRPFHAEEATLPIEMELPRDLPNGTYELNVSDWLHYLMDERTSNPFKFTASNIDELFEVVRDVISIRHDAIYLRLLRQADGVAVGRTAMPRLPSSSRQVLLDSGRSDITRFVSSSVKIVSTDLVMTGSADFTITIEKHGTMATAK